MKPVHAVFATLLLASAACNDDALKSKLPAEPQPPAQGAQAFVQVDNDKAQPGERVSVLVRVQVGTENQAKVGSYTGRLKFDPAALAWVSDQQIEDGLRVTNPKGAEAGEIRFAGAAPSGFNDLALYRGTFEVKKTDYVSNLVIQMDELSAARTLGDMKAQLQIAPRVFLRAGAQ